MLMSTAGTIILSLVTGLISFYIGRLWKNIIQPWVQSIWWTGINLKQSYKGEFQYKGQILHDHIDVKQKAGKVWGTMVAPEGREGSYNFNATLASNGVLRGTFEGSGKTSTVRGSFLLASKAGSSEMAGWCVEPVEGVVIAYEYKWLARV